MFNLISTIDAMKATIPEIAKQLVARGMVPEGKSTDPNPQRRWETILKKGARERGRATSIKTTMGEPMKRGTKAERPFLVRVQELRP